MKKKTSKKDIEKIIKKNRNVDRDLLIKSQKELKELRKIAVIQSGFNLVIPYSRSVRSCID